MASSLPRLRVLVAHGLSVDLRGKTPEMIARFGPLTMEDYNQHVLQWASELGLDVEIVHSNVDRDLCAAIARHTDPAGPAPVRGIVLNPGFFTTQPSCLPDYLGGVRVPVVEVHYSNPSTKGVVSPVAPHCAAVVTGFGVHSYHLGLLGLKQLLQDSAAKA